MARANLLFFVYASFLLFSVAECFVLSFRSHDVTRLQPSPTPANNRSGGTSNGNRPLLKAALKAIKNDESTTTENKLSSLGYTDDEIVRSQNRESRQPKEKLSVRVNLLPDIDSVTLTAIGFGLIAFNFFVLGNLEDGGIAGVVATIINTLSQ